MAAMRASVRIAVGASLQEAERLGEERLLDLLSDAAHALGLALTLKPRRSNTPASLMGVRR